MSDQSTGRPRTIQTHIESVFEQSARQEWSPTDLYQILRDDGHTHSLDHVTVALSRMVDRGALERVSYGRYRRSAQRPVTVTQHYRPSSVTGAVSCSMCGGLVADNDAEKATHTRFHRTWTR